MPSPIGHALAGAAIAWGAEVYGREPGERPARAANPGRLALVCAGLAVLPDLDLLYIPIHRTATHSVAAVALTTIIAAVVTGWVTGRIRWPIAIACGAAYASHIMLDWLGADASRPHGLQALWPFTDRWFISPWTIFPGTERRAPLSGRSLWINARAAAVEIAIMGPVAYGCWRWRMSSASDESDGRHAGGEADRAVKPGKSGAPGNRF
jgi:membrane-bound metal-dependent hydrolase YbcI (DUF457 family)